MPTPDGHKPIALRAEYLPLAEQAERGLLPDTLTIAEIAALHPNGEDFAALLLSDWAVHLHRTGQGFALGDPPAEEYGAGLPGELTDIHAAALLSIPEYAEISVADHADIVRVHRDDLRRWLDEIGYWPLAHDALLNRWWPNEERENLLSEDAAGDASGPVFENRLRALEQFLTEQEIPREDWDCLKARHGYSLDSIYQSLAQRPAFRSQHGRGDPIGKGTFKRKFWKEQSIADLN